MKKRDARVHHMDVSLIYDHVYKQLLMYSFSQMFRHFTRSSDNDATFSNVKSYIIHG